MQNSFSIIPIYIIYPKELEEMEVKENLSEDIDSVTEDRIKSILYKENDVHTVKSYNDMYLQEISLPTLTDEGKK